MVFARAGCLGLECDGAVNVSHGKAGRVFVVGLIKTNGRRVMDCAGYYQRNIRSALQREQGMPDIMTMRIRVGRPGAEPGVMGY